MAARRGRRDRVVPLPTGGPGPDPGGGVRGGGWTSRSQAPYGTVGTVSAAEQVHEEGDDSSFINLSRLGPSLRDKDLEMEELILQDETLLGTMQSYMDASLISLIEDFGSLGESRLSLEDQNEMSLLTALTEILDNADSENLSPFDSIPDSELLVSPRESSSLHKLLTLSRTPPEHDLITPIDPLGPSTGSSRMSGVEMSLADSPWDFSPPPFLETSSPKLPSWRPSRPRPRWGQSPVPQQRSDGEEEDEVASFSGQMLVGELNNSVNSLDFPMHLACPEEEDKPTAAEVAVSAPADESISSLSELVRAMHPYCLPNLTHLASLEDELQEQVDDLTAPEGCVVLEIVGQAATAGDDLEIPVVVRQIPSGSQSLLLDESAGASPALQLLMPTMEARMEAAVPKVAPCPDQEELSLNSACLLEPREIMESLAPKELQNLPASAIQGSQRIPSKGRKKKSKEQPAACLEGYTRRLRSSSRGLSTVATEVNSQAGNLQKQPQEELQREAEAPQSRGKPRAWARAWAAALKKTESENLERSAGQDSPAEEDALDLCPKLVDTSQADPMPVDSVEADAAAAKHVIADCIPVDQASASTELIGPLPVGPVLTDPVLTDRTGIEPAVSIPTLDNLSPAGAVLANTVTVDSVPHDLAPVDPVLVKHRPTDPRRAAAAAAAQGARLSLDSSAHPKVIDPEVKAVAGPLKVEGSTSTTTQEARPRPLSLSEYRQRRQQRQTEAEGRNSQPPAGKWPSLPETPTGLADIPCLVPPAPAKKTAPHRSSVAIPETCFVSVGTNPASPTPEPSASKPMVCVHSEQVPSHEMPLPVRPPLPTLQSVSPGPIPSTVPTLPFPPGIPPLLPLPSSGHGVLSLPPPPLQPPGLPVSMRQIPPDPYTHYTPVPPWPCYPSVSPSGYPCLPPQPTVPMVSGTPGTYAVPPTCNVPWVPTSAPVSPYSSSCAYGHMGWGPGPQQPPFWSSVSPPPLSSATTGRAVPPSNVEPSSNPAGSPEDELPVPVTPSLSSGPDSPIAPSVEPMKLEVQPVPVSPQLKHKVSTLVQSLQVKTPLCLSTECVAVGESASERLKPEAQENRAKEKPLSATVKAGPIPRQSTAPKLPAVHPARLRKLSFLPTPRSQGPEDVVQAFISEIGIEASDLSSLLEQFEKSEAKKECPLPAPADSLAVGNSGSIDTPQEKRPLDRLQAPELANVAGLTPPATPPHQLWKPLAAVSLLAKSPKSTAQEGTLKPEGVTEAKHPAAACLQERVHGPSPVHVGSGDHDYCVRSRTPPKKMPALVIPEVGSRWNVKRHQDITIKPVLSLGPAVPLLPCMTSQEPLDHRTSSEQAEPPAPCLAPSTLLSPEASPCRKDMNTRTPSEPPGKQRSMRCYRKACRSVSPPGRGWQGRRGRSSRSVSSGSNRTSEASSSSSVSSSSRSRSRSLSPPHKRWRRSSCSSSGRSRRCSSSSSSSSSSSPSSGSRSRSPSLSPRRSNRRRRYSSYRSNDHYQRQRVLQKERAIEERRVVFIGKIPGRMTRSELKQRFSVFGEIEECTIHFRVQGDNYGFVTYRYAEEAFAAIESGHKLRQADEQPFDLCFGGRRQFCKRSYSDLDSNREDFDPAPVKSKFDSLDFDTLLKQAQKNLRR